MYLCLGSAWTRESHSILLHLCANRGIFLGLCVEYCQLAGGADYVSLPSLSVQTCDRIVCINTDRSVHSVDFGVIGYGISQCLIKYLHRISSFLKSILLFTSGQIPETLMN